MWTLLVISLVFCDLISAVTDVTVIQLQLNYAEEYSLSLNSSVEYILKFTTSDVVSDFPTRIWSQTSAGDITHPVLFTSIQNTGVMTWQLPYQQGNVQMYQIEKTLCVQSNGINHPSCDDDTFAGGDGFSLQIRSSCGAVVKLMATLQKEFRLEVGSVVETTAMIWSPTVHFYNFTEGEDSVRLVVTSTDEVCARVSVQNFTCPILQTEVDLPLAGLRMTMLKSGAVFLKRSKFPNGFYVVVVVLSSEQDCSGTQTEEVPLSVALWDRAVFGLETVTHPQGSRNKNITISIQPTLTIRQYAAASFLTFAIFLLFYVMVLALTQAQRWPKLAKYVSPIEPPSVNNTQDSIVVTELTASNEQNRQQRRRSVQTLDSGSDSLSDEDSDIESEMGVSPSAAPSNSGAQPQENGNRATEQVNGQGTSQSGAGPRPFNVPGSLSVAVLSRLQLRTHTARADRYLHTLYTVAVFYTLPVIQFVAAFQILFNVSGSLDTCYYNFLCSHPVGEMSDFNHFWSNIGYLMLGGLFMLQVRRRRQRRKLQPKNQEYGIPAHYGLLSSLGAGMMVVAVLSASYHLCPNRLNFQFDTAFMYVLSVVSMVKIYQSRHPDINARAHSTFGVLAVLMALVVWGVLGGGGLFWGAFTVFHIFTFLLLSLRIYYVGQFKLQKETIQMAARGLASLPKYGIQPLYTTRLVLLLIANAVNWAFALYGLYLQAGDFAGHLLQVLLGNTLMYMIFYLVMKLRHGERPRWYAWCFLAGAAISWGPSLYFFISGSSDWSTTPAKSRELNHECIVLEFYDAHDLWHILSAVALYLSFNAMMTWDDGLYEVKRTEIAVF